MLPHALRRLTLALLWCVVCVTGLLVPDAVRAEAQTLSHSTSALSIAAPTAAQYDAASPGNVTSASGSYTLNTTCTGGGGNGCRLFIGYGTNAQGQQLAIQWQMTSRTSLCSSAVALNTWQDITTGVVLSTNKNDACTATFQLRVKDLAYNVHQAPGRLNTTNPYQQNVTFTFTRP